jgi:hypothetical protein
MGEATRTHDEPDPTAVAAFDVAPELFPVGSAHRFDEPADDATGRR